MQCWQPLTCRFGLAEFSDGSDVAVATEAPAEFTDETEAAPVVEDSAEEVSTAQAEADYTVNTNMQLKSDTWAEKLSFEKKNETDKTETFEITKGGIPVDNFYYEVDYNGDMAYRSSAAVNFKGLQNELQNENATAPTLAKYKDGKAVSIRLYSDKKCTDLIYTFKTTSESC